MKKVKNIFIFLSVLVFLTLFISSASAADHTITNSTDGGLNKSVTDANNGDRIYLEQGTYTNNVSNIIIDKNITIIGKSGADKTIIDAQKLNKIFNVTSTGNLLLINITLLNGYTTTNGSAIYTKGNVTIEDCVFKNNTATNSNGTIFCEVWSENFLKITNSKFINNAATYGGGIYFTGYGRSSVSNTEFTNNSATNSGGGIHQDGGIIQYTNLTFNNQKAFFGGAMSLIHGEMHINNTNFINNKVTGLGGAIYSNGPTEGRSPVSVYIDNSYFTNNSADFGGAIYGVGKYYNPNVYIDCDYQINNTMFINNTASDGGALYTVNGFDIFGCTFINNTATEYAGGALYSSINSSVIKSTFINNTAAEIGGAIYSFRTLIIEYCVLYNNTDKYGHMIHSRENATIANNNWWGSNNIEGYFNENVNVDNHYIMNLTINDIEYVGDKLIVTYRLLENNSLTDLNVRYLPKFQAILYYNGEYLGSVDDARFEELFNTIVKAKDNNIHVWFYENDVNNLTFPAKEKIIPPNPEPPIPPVDPDENNTNNNTDPNPDPNPNNPEDENNTKSPNNPTITNASMKETGLPIIAIFIILLSSLGLLVRRK